MKTMIKISVVVTVKNDDEGVKRLLADLKRQTVKPDEIVVVKASPKPCLLRSGGFQPRATEKGGMLIRVVEVGADCSRGRGRNIGIKMAKNEFIAVTDVGCRPRRDWLERLIANGRECLTANHANERIIAVGGWYRAVAKTPLQRAFGPYLVPRNDTNNYLPASRSIGFTKSAWELVGGYPENASSGGEDLGFAVKLVHHPEVKMVYAPRALVDWELPETWREFFRDMVKHTRGNFEIGYWPHMWRNLSVVARWAIMAIWPWMIAIYLGLEIKRRIKVINNIKIITIILMVRLVADAAVIYGVISIIIIKWVIKRQ